MIADLDRTLEALLKHELPEDLIRQVNITFAAPDEAFPPTSVKLPALDLFLYDVRENRELRSNEWILERNTDGTAVQRRSPVRIDCSYLITAWASDGSPTPAHDEHHILSETLRAILRHPRITKEKNFLQGSLRDQAPDVATVSIQPGHLQSLAEFWQALGGKPKAALNYTVTIGIEPDGPKDDVNVVTDKRLQFGPIERKEP
jgi:hypothetical protein